MKLLTIEIEGIDKCGKDLIVNYINRLANFKYVVHARGMLSNMVYDEKFGRNYDYELTYKPVIIYLDVDEEDRLIRCIFTKEEPIDADSDRKLFEKYIKVLKDKGITILRYNTSKDSPYHIAKQIITDLEQLF